METLRHDLRDALRTFVKNPAFAAMAIVTLAIGIGANTAIFTVVEAALLRPLPYRNVEKLVYISESNTKETNAIRQASYPDYTDWKRARNFDGVAAYTASGFFAGIENPEFVPAARITADFFRVLGVSLSSGRYFTDAEENGQGRVAILSHAYSQRRFGPGISAIGQTLELNAARYTIVGVLPPEFHFAPAGAADIWVPLNPTASQRERRFMHWLYVIGRVKDGVSAQAAQEEMTSIGARIAEADKQFHAGSFVRIGSLRESIIGNVRPILMGLFVAVGLVLLIACANVANLALARSAARQREIAIRVAVGASRWRLTRQLLTETLLLSFFGGAIGIAVAPRCAEILISRIPPNQLNTMPYLRGSGVSATVLLFVAAAVIATGAVCGLVPAIRTPAADIRSAMARRRNRLRSAFVVAEVALALLLLASTGLLVKSVVRLLRVDPGFNTANLLMMRLSLLPDRYKKPSQRDAYFRRVLEQLEALPDVQGAAGVDLLPLNGGGNTGIPTIEGTAAPLDFSSNVRTILDNYFEVMGIPLLHGRLFTERDSAAAPRVVLVNRAFALRAFGNQDALGRRMSFAFVPDTVFEIAGVVGDENVTGLDSARSPVIYFPYSQDPASTMSLVIRTAMRPEAVLGSIRRAISAVDASVPIAAVRTMDELISISPYTFSRRYPATLLGILAVVALVLSSIGIYGVIAHSVTQRIREWGVRIALGATRAEVFRMILKEGSKMSGLGIAIGLAAALVVTRWMSGLLFETPSDDPAVFVSVAIVLMVVTLLACYIPARRATRVDPWTALRSD